MIVIAGGVLLALVLFAVLRRVFVPLVLIGAALWLWSGIAHSQTFTELELNVMMEQSIAPVARQMRMVMAAIRCGVLEEPASTAAVLTLRNEAGMVAIKYESPQRRQRIAEMVKSAESVRPTPAVCSEMRADAAFTSSLKMWASNLN